MLLVGVNDDALRYAGGSFFANMSRYFDDDFWWLSSPRSRLVHLLISSLASVRYLSLVAVLAESNRDALARTDGPRLATTAAFLVSLLLVPYRLLAGEREYDGFVSNLDAKFSRVEVEGFVQRTEFQLVPIVDGSTPLVKKALLVADRLGVDHLFWYGLPLMSTSLSR